MQHSTWGKQFMSYMIEQNAENVVPRCKQTYEATKEASIEADNDLFSDDDEPEASAPPPDRNSQLQDDGDSDDEGDDSDDENEDQEHNHCGLFT